MKTAEECCEQLLSCAEGHGQAEGSEMWIGDLEDFLRAAFDLLTPEQFARFWDDPRVKGNVSIIVEYRGLAAKIYDLEEPEEAAIRCDTCGGPIPVGVHGHTCPERLRIIITHAIPEDQEGGP
jgi:hypothetical protein